MPYGYPSGKVLTETIGKRFVGNPSERFLGLHSDAIENFRQEVHKSGFTSIDEFISTRNDPNDLGKKLLAFELLTREDVRTLSFPTNDIVSPRLDNPDANRRRSSLDQRWYKDLLNLLGRTRDELELNKLTIVTFNYDRSLEQFLTDAISTRFRLTPEEAWKTLNHIRIIHLHGDLGPLPFQIERAGQKWAYGGPVAEERIEQASKGINLIHDGHVGGSPPFIPARDALEEAEFVFALGFGWHELNIRRLGLDLTKRGVEGTGYGLTPEMAEHIQGHLASHSKLYPCDTIEFMQRSAPFIRASHKRSFDL